MEYRFTKMHGIGNDFVVFDTFAVPLSFSREQIQYIADRHYGIGCDQVLLLEPDNDQGVAAYYRIFNADGSEVMQCGNGARCVALYLREKGLADGDELVVRTGVGELTLKVECDNNITVNMGAPEFEPSRIPLRQKQKADLYEVPLGDETLRFAALSMGNPHAVIKVDDVQQAEVTAVGAALQRHALFPDSVNVGFMEILNRQAFKLRVFERGVGETLACASGACASMVAARQQGELEETAEAELRGGHLRLSWTGPGEPVYMTGEAAIVYEGKLDL